MKKVNWSKIRAKIKATDKAVLTKVVNSVDGHSIYGSKHFTENGLDGEIVAAFSKKLESGNSPKEQIFDKNDNPVSAMEGVYGLDVLECIASVLDVNSYKMGRGSRVNHLAEQLVTKFSN